MMVCLYRRALDGRAQNVVGRRAKIDFAKPVDSLAGMDSSRHPVRKGDARWTFITSSSGLKPTAKVISSRRDAEVLQRS
jgi:hypothetical protein